MKHNLKDVSLTLLLIICAVVFVIGCLMTISEAPTPEASVEWDFARNIYGAITAVVSYLCYQGISAQVK